MKYFEISLIIPAYNEEKKIEKDIRRAYGYFKKANISGEIIVSTDGVTDNTNIIVKSLQKEISNLKLISEKQKIGKGSAIKKGVAKSHGKVIMFADAGYCVPFSHIMDGLKILDTGTDCALASRIESKSKIVSPQPLYRKIGSKVFSALVRYLLGIPKNIKDTQCGFKMYRAKKAKILFSKSQTQGFMFDIELILLAKKLKYTQKQFPVSWSNDSDTKFKVFSGSLKILKELIQIKLLYKL